ncbi:MULTISPECIES: hypothetical protein [unclassified Pseudomonas]|uniref:hypothetical protein n=1 Tax=unclassified Pseudomonas TaxID=196821 RepID=UPI0011AEED47|nr:MULTISPECIES: hypothetical protein [unclassified Pseudomonas]
MHKTIMLSILCSGLYGCSTALSTQTAGEENSGFTYIPLDPFPVVTVPGDSCRKTSSSEIAADPGYIPSALIPQGLDTPAYEDILSSLPDNAVRMVVENITIKGSISYGAGKIGGNQERYRITADYISADTINMPVWIKRQVMYSFSPPNHQGSTGTRPDNLTLAETARETYSTNVDNQPLNFKRLSEKFFVKRAKRGEEPPFDYYAYNIPVYVGIGIRIISNVEITGKSANISGIGAIGLESQANNLKGSLVVQTLGVNGKAVSSALPMQSELNATTAQNALIATASIKTLLYSDDTHVYPRVVGLYLPFPSNKALVNAIISELSSSQVEWKRPCKWISSKKITP